MLCTLMHHVAGRGSLGSRRGWCGAEACLLLMKLHRAADAPASRRPRTRDSIVRRRSSSIVAGLFCSAVSGIGTALGIWIVCSGSANMVGVIVAGVPAYKCNAACTTARDIATHNAFPTARCPARDPAGSLQSYPNPIRMADSLGVITLHVAPSRSDQVRACDAHTVNDWFSTDRRHGFPFLFRVWFLK